MAGKWLDEREEKGEDLVTPRVNWDSGAARKDYALCFSDGLRTLEISVAKKERTYRGTKGAVAIS